MKYSTYDNYVRKLYHQRSKDTDKVDRQLVGYLKKANTDREMSYQDLTRLRKLTDKLFGFSDW